MLNRASPPCPSPNPGELLPASVATRQKQGGWEINPGSVQAVAGEQRVAGAGFPPGQAKPTPQSVALSGEVEPGGHPYPGGPLQVPLQEGLASPVSFPHTPAGHSVQVIEPGVE